MFAANQDKYSFRPPCTLLSVAMHLSILQVNRQGLASQCTKKFIIIMLQSLILLMKPSPFSPAINSVLSSISLHGVSKGIHDLFNIVQTQQISTNSLTPCPSRPEALGKVNQPLKKPYLLELSKYNKAPALPVANCFGRAPTVTRAVWTGNGFQKLNNSLKRQILNLFAGDIQ